MTKRTVKIVGVTLTVVAVLWASWLTAGIVASHPLPNRIIAAVGNLVSGDCTLAGCSSALTVDVGQPFNGGVTYDIVLCLEAECWQDQVIFKDRVNDSGDPLLVEHKGTISVHLPNVPRPLTSQVSLTVWADGAEMVDHQGQVLFQ